MCTSLERQQQGWQGEMPPHFTAPVVLAPRLLLCPVAAALLLRPTNKPAHDMLFSVPALPPSHTHHLISSSSFTCPPTNREMPDRRRCITPRCCQRKSSQRLLLLARVAARRQQPRVQPTNLVSARTALAALQTCASLMVTPA